MQPGDKLNSILGGKTAKALATSLDIETVADLLAHYPRRYLDRSVLTPLSDLRVDEEVTVLAEVVSSRSINQGRRSRLEAEITDGHGRIKLTFFNQPWRAGQLKPGVRGLFAGKVGEYRGMRQFAHPQYQLLTDEADAADQVGSSLLTQPIIPVYPASSRVTSWQIAQSMALVLPGVSARETLPDWILHDYELMALDEATKLIHAPTSFADVAAARERLKFDEALTLQLALLLRRQAQQALPAQARPWQEPGLIHEFVAQLPFDLTAGQWDVVREISKDLSTERPMHRLLQGDVGSGKTIVALFAMLQVVAAGGQAVLIAPTEVLAHQHCQNLADLLGPLGLGDTLEGAPDATSLAYLSGGVSAGQRRRELARIASGEAGIIVGTHALFEDSVQYADLGLVVIDEQHRFGVEQRSRLLTRSTEAQPHMLVLTATPIPRTVAMTTFGDLAVSTLKERPAQRQAVTSHVVPEENPTYYARVWERVAEEVAQGHKVFVVCPRIDASDEVARDEDELHSVADTADYLASLYPELRIGQLHGRMGADEKNLLMRQFADSERADAIDVLVSTTVIEVGVDVPTATLMVILNADRFGVSQLHQLRGRVGRGSDPGLCLLVTSRAATASFDRLTAVAGCNDGFELAEIDLAERREGDVLGESQSGHKSSLQLLSVLTDADVIAQVRVVAQQLIDRDPDLATAPELAAAARAQLSTDNYLDQG